MGLVGLAGLVGLVGRLITCNIPVMNLWAKDWDWDASVTSLAQST